MALICNVIAVAHISSVNIVFIYLILPNKQCFVVGTRATKREKVALRRRVELKRPATRSKQEKLEEKREEGLKIPLGGMRSEQLGHHLYQGKPKTFGHSMNENI